MKTDFKSILILSLILLILIQNLFICFKNEVKTNKINKNEIVKDELSILEYDNFYNVFYKKDSVLFKKVFQNAMKESPILAYFIALENYKINKNKNSLSKIDEAKYQLDAIFEPYINKENLNNSSPKSSK